MNLVKNLLIEWLWEKDCEKALRVERILYIESKDGFIVTIDIFSLKSIPLLRRYGEIAASIENGAAKILTEDPYIEKANREDIEYKHKVRRDASYELIAEIVEMDGIDQYLPWKRGKIITEIAARRGRSKQHIYDLLRRYWMYGQTKNALLPMFKCCGAPGKRRTGDSQNQAKLGRKSNKSKQEGKNIGVRLILSTEIKFALGIKKFYEVKNKKKSLKTAFQKILETYFNIGFELKDGTPIPILPPAEDLPTFRQFRYWYDTVYRDPVKSIKNIFGEKSFNLKSRELLGDATSIAFGPGSVYQIDATIADIYLVSSLNRNKIIGRPVIYVVIDVFSRLIVGVAVLLEGPSWYGAMLALDNVVENKVAYCAKFGINIEPEEWPVNALPEAILADRGEFEGYNVESLINVFGINVQNTAPYRADWKAIVERHFGIATEKFIKYSPGGVIKKKERGDRDYRLDAKYTLHEFETLTIAHVLNYNEAHELKYYRKDQFQIADDVERFPIDIWNWGMEQRTGYLRTFPRNIVRLNLLPRKEVSVTAQGIHFSHQLYYTCETAIREGWFVRARNRGSWKISVAYHPHSTNHVYFPINGGKDIEVCNLTKASQAFQNADFSTIENYFYGEVIASENSLDRQRRSDAKFNARHNHITTEATEKTQIAQYDAGKQSKHSKIKGIRENRLEVRDAERESNLWDLSNGEENNSVPSNSDFSVPENGQSEEYIPPPDYTNRLSAVLKQHRNNKENKK